MSSPPLSPLPTPSGFPFGDVLLYFGGTAIISVLGFFGVRFTATAPLQMAMNDAFRSVTAELQQERAQLIVRISELERKTADQEMIILQKDGEIRGLKQSRDSLLALLRRSGIQIPGEKEA